MPEGGLIAVKYGQCLIQQDDNPMFTPGNRYCEYQGGHPPGAMPFARTGRFTLTLRNDGSADATPSVALNRNSGSGRGCDTTTAGTGNFEWRSADLEAIAGEQFQFSYTNIPVAANSIRVIRFEMASRPDYEIDGDCVWGFRLNGIQFATLTVEDDEARPYVGPVPGPHPYGAIWRATCLIDGKGVRIISRQCVYE